MLVVGITDQNLVEHIVPHGYGVLLKLGELGDGQHVSFRPLLGTLVGTTDLQDLSLMTDLLLLHQGVEAGCLLADS